MPGEIFGGWTTSGTRRIWVRVPMELKERAERANGNGAAHGANGSARSRTIAELADELRTPFWGRSPLNGAGEDLAEPPIVFVHGIASSGRGMEPLLSELGSKRAAFAPDLPGFGRSEPPPHVLDVDGLAEALRRWMIDHRIAPAAIVGASFGCQIAIDLASNHPELVDRLILIGPTDPEALVGRGYAWRWLTSAARGSPHLDTTVVRDFIDARPWQIVRSLQLAAEDPVEEKLGSIVAPTLVVRGERQLAGPDSWAARIDELIPNARVETLPGAVHIHGLAGARRLTPILESFLAEEHPLEPEPDITDEPADEEGRPARLVVDGMNVIGSRPDGWWRDRERAWRGLARRLERHARDTGDDVHLVIDGRRPSGWHEDRLIETSFANGKSADDAIVAWVAADPHPETLRVVTSDRELGGRVEELGARVVPAGALLSELESR
jgi:pimeloyl-ACP methyl ester carboxylesterase/predicted RNA-binding protein with PIN domain